MRDQLAATEDPVPEGLRRSPEEEPVAPVELVLLRGGEEAPEAPAGTTRRTVVTRGLLLVLGAVGVAAAGRKVADETAAPPAAADAPATLTLVAPDVRYHAAGARPGRLPAAGERGAPHARLVDARGRPAGEFHSALLPGPVGEIEVHRFALADGTIMGMGSGSRDGEAFAVVGGTGRFAGMTGSYETRRLDNGGRGVELVFTLRNGR